MQMFTKITWPFTVLSLLLIVSCTQSNEGTTEHTEAAADSTHPHIISLRGIAIRDDLAPKIENLIEKQGVPSVSIAVFDASEIIWAEAFGMANIAQNVRADINTVYTTGSTFKTIMVTAVMQLVEAGKVDLDQPINTYLSTPIDDLANQGNPLTVRQTLVHRAGFANARTQGTTDIWSRNAVPPPASQIADIRVVAIPGETFDYCNICFVLLADVIENVTGRDLEDYLRDEILVPVGSKITAPLYPDATMTERMALPYEQHGGNAYPIPIKFLHPSPSGDTYLRPLDMAFFLQSHLDGATDSSKQLLSDAFIKLMQEPQFGGDVTLGFLATDEDGIRVLGWDGGTLGGSVIFEIEAGNGIGIYVASNSHDTHTRLHEIARRVRDLLREEDDPFDYDILPSKQATPPKLDRDALQAYTGYYKIDGADVELSIDILNEGLALTNPAGKRIRLAMLSKEEAILIGTHGEHIVFDHGSQGAIVSFTLTSGDTSFSASKAP